MECGNNLELKERVKHYLTIDEQVTSLYEEKLAISATYYTLHSLVGGMPLGSVERIYHRAESTEQIVFHILEREALIQRKIDSLKHSQSLFKQCIGTVDTADIERDLQLHHVTELVHQAYEAVGEVEYYLDQHSKYEKRQVDESVLLLNTEVKAAEKNVFDRLELMLGV